MTSQSPWWRADIHQDRRPFLLARGAITRAARRWFEDRGFTEVEGAALQVSPGNEAHLHAFATEIIGNSGETAPLYLHTSPEFACKKLLAAGETRIFDFARVWRNRERGPLHHPEFTLLEWYRVGWDHLRLIEETAELVRAALSLLGRDASLRVIRYRDLYRGGLGLDPLTASDGELRAALGDIVIDPAGLTRDDWLDLLMTHRLQPAFDPDGLLAIVDYPASQCALARLRDDGDGFPVAERFELYFGSIELANGYHELLDASEQRARFQRDGIVRQQRGDVVPPMDIRLLAGLEVGLPACAGVALGVDRLLMAMLGTPRIADVLAFDFARA